MVLTAPGKTELAPPEAISGIRRTHRSQSSLDVQNRPKRSPVAEPRKIWASQLAGAITRSRNSDVPLHWRRNTPPQVTPVVPDVTVTLSS